MLAALLAFTIATRQVGVPGVWAVAAHGDFLASAYDEKFVDLWLISTGKHVRRLKFAGLTPAGDIGNAQIVALDFSPDGTLLVGGNETPEDGYAPLWEVSTGREIAKLGQFSAKDSSEAPTQAFFTLDGEYVLGTSNIVKRPWNCYAWSPRSGRLNYIAGGGDGGAV